MTRIKLSICIPVFNNIRLFKICLGEVCNSIVDYDKNDVEIIVSDNDSSDNISDVVNGYIYKFPTVSIIYNKNIHNIGMAHNFLKVVECAKGDFCWIIGSDDFIFKDSVKQIINLIANFPQVDFISCKMKYLDVSNDDIMQIKHQLSGMYISNNEIIENYHPVHFKDLIHPKNNNVYLGSIMIGIFRRSVWEKIDKSKILSNNNFNSLPSMYPHCYIYALGFMESKAIEYGHPLIVAGDGKRDWTTDNGVNYWKSSLPLIFYTILTNMILNYRNHGLEKTNYRECVRETSSHAGRIFLPLLFQKIAKKTDIKDYENMDFKKMTCFYLKHFHFYLGIAKSILKPNLIHWR